MEETPAKRLDFKFVLAEVTAFLSWEKGVPYTTRALVRSPGATIHRYLDGDRSRLTNPVRYLLMSCALTTAAFIFFMPRDQSIRDLERGMELSGARTSETTSELESKLEDARTSLKDLDVDAVPTIVRKNSRTALTALDRSLAEQLTEISLTWMNVFLLLALPINASLSWLFFRKSRLNVTEHIAANAYILGFQNFLSLFMVPFAALGYSVSSSTVYMFASFIFQFIAWKQTFRLHSAIATVIGFGTLILSVLAYVTLHGVGLTLILRLGTP